MNSSSRLLAILSLSFVAAGCTGLRRSLGFTQDLKKEQVVSLTQRLSPDTALCPGHTRELIVDVALADGRMLQSEGAGKGRVSWDALRFEGRGVQVTAEGRITAPEDGRTYGRGPVVVKVSSVDHPHLSSELVVPMRFNCEYAWDLSGGDGTDGAAGVKGSDSVPLGASAQNGTDGEAGSNGGAGGSFTVRAALARGPGEEELLQLHVRGGTGKERFLLLDPKGGILKLRSVGGDGGRGGDGGNGGEPSGMAGSGGSGGEGGPGGDLTMIFDEDARPYTSLIVIENDGGKGAARGSRGSNGKKAGLLLNVVTTVFSGGSDGADGEHGSVTTDFAPLDPLW